MVDSRYFPSVTDEALRTFENIPDSIYIGSATGKSMAQESMPCMCVYDSELDDPSNACGNDNKCINRMMFMECMVQDCPCGHLCRNRRFQLAQYATVDVIKTEKKGYGLRALKHLPKNSFVMEYIGEIIPQSEFIRRTKEYDAEGYEHYYFMTLKKDEIIDATKKGCLARFMNHSCNPNCVTQKWVIGKKMRIGIFTCRMITAGEELTFDYKFERYGAMAQNCYCGEPNCKGYIGTTEKESIDNDTEDDEEDVLSSITSSDDEEDDNSIQATANVRPLEDLSKVHFFVKRMLNSVGKPRLVNKLLARLLMNNNSSQGKDILKMIVRLHGLKMLKFWLGEWKQNEFIITKVLQVLEKLPLANRNGLEDCKLFDVVQKFVSYENDEISRLSQYLLDKWSKLKSVYRIPKREHVDFTNEQDEEEDEVDSVTSSANDSMKKQYLKSYYEQKRKRRRVKYESTREYFDPDHDYFEYFSMNVLPEELAQKTQQLSRRHYKKPASPLSITNNNSNETPVSINTSDSPNTPIVGNHCLPIESSTSISQKNPSTILQYQYYYQDPSIYNNYYYYYSHEYNTYTHPTTNSHWQVAVAENGSTYYYHILTQQTQWEVPEELIKEQQQQAPPPPPLPAQDETPPPPPPPTSCEHQPEPSSHLLTPASVDEIYLNDIDLKREIGGVVTKYLSSKQQQELWKGDKYLFKDLARKMTHHIVDKEIQSGRKIKLIDSGLRLKIEKFIDAYGMDYATKLMKQKNKVV